MRTDSSYLMPLGLAPVAREAKRRLAHRVTRMSHAMLGFLGLWAAACGQDKQQEEQSEVAVVMKNMNFERSLAVRQHQLQAADGDAPVTHVIVMGDSISAGLGAEGKPLSYAELLYKNYDDRYPELHGQDLASLFGDQLNYVNVAHAGDTTIDVLTQQLPRLRKILAEQAEQGVPGVVPSANGAGFTMLGRVLVVMTVGGNDVQAAMRPNPNFTGSTLSKSLINLRSIFAFFRDEQTFAGGISPFFGNVYDTTDGTDQMHLCKEGLAFPGMSEALNVWSESFATLAEQEDATLVDTLSLFHGHGFNFYDPTNPYFDARDTTLWVYDRDCIHPNNRGHDMIRRAFFSQIAGEFLRGKGASHRAR